MLSLSVEEVLEPGKLVIAGPDATVAHAAELMRSNHVGAVLVVEGERLVGIFTERDAVYRVMASGRDPSVTPLGDVMTRDPRTVEHDETLGYALMLMHEHGFRHAPVLADGRPIGVVSARYALDPDLEEFAAEAERRNTIRRRAAVQRASP